MCAVEVAAPEEEEAGQEEAGQEDLPQHLDLAGEAAVEMCRLPRPPIQTTTTTATSMTQPLK